MLDPVARSRLPKVDDASQGKQSRGGFGGLSCRPFPWRVPMTMVRWFGLVGMAVVLAAPAARAQDFPKPGPEHELLKKWVGTWDTTMKMQGAESKGVATYKMELGGLWLASTYEGEFGGMK